MKFRFVIPRWAWLLGEIWRIFFLLCLTSLFIVFMIYLLKHYIWAGITFSIFAVIPFIAIVLKTYLEDLKDKDNLFSPPGSESITKRDVELSNYVSLAFILTVLGPLLAATFPNGYIIGTVIVSLLLAWGIFVKKVSS